MRNWLIVLGLFGISSAPALAAKARPISPPLDCTIKGGVSDGKHVLINFGVAGGNAVVVNVFYDQTLTNPLVNTQDQTLINPLQTPQAGPKAPATPVPDLSLQDGLPPTGKMIDSTATLSGFYQQARLTRLAYVRVNQAAFVFGYITKITGIPNDTPPTQQNYIDRFYEVDRITGDFSFHYDGVVKSGTCGLQKDPFKAAS